MNWRLPLVLLAALAACAPTRQMVTYSEPRFSASQYKCVVVAPFENMSRTKGAGLVVADSISNAFYASRSFRVVERNEVQRYLTANNLDTNIRMDPGQAIELGTALNADAVLIGAVTDYWYRSLDSKPEVSVSLRVVDVKAQKVVYVASANYQPQFISTGPSLLTFASKLVADALVGPMVTGIQPRDLGTQRCGMPETVAPSKAPLVVQAPPPPSPSIEIAEPAPISSPATEAVAVVTPEPVPAKTPEPVMTAAVFRLIRRMADLKSFVADDIVFELDKTAFRGDKHVAFLENLGVAMQAKPALKIRIETHTDGLGDPNFNRQLTEQRAALLKQYLVTKYNIDPNRIQTAGYGGDKPLLPNINRKNREANRRVEIVVVQGP